ncbi:MAG: helix-turn-helix domain-containing protein [Cyanobacteria bacterium J083]|nr:MAG: helix-turn-helix domain-containing protein [Cyanobacteria bacterium J083]
MSISLKNNQLFQYKAVEQFKIDKYLTNSLSNSIFLNREIPKVMNSIDLHQLEQFQKMGDELRQMRLAQAISLEEIAQDIMISPRLLQAIEAADMETLPEPIYTRELIKKYAAYLGLGGKEFVADFFVPVNVAEDKSLPWLKKISLPQLRPFHLYIFYLILVLTSVNHIARLVDRSDLTTATITTTEIELNSPPVQETAQSLSHQTVTEVVTKPDTPRSVAIQITIKEQSWLKVIADGKTKFEGILPAGTNRTWSAKQKLTLRVGNAGGVLITSGNQEAKQLGKPGQVEEVTYTLDSQTVAN